MLALIPGNEAGRIHKSKTTSDFDKLTIDSWFSGKFQESFSNYTNDNLGLFPLFVRIRNQIDYSFFKIAHTGLVIAGKEDFLYEKRYIDSYFGKDYIGDSLLSIKTEKLKALQDSLEIRGKSFLVCIAPGKGSYFPEYIPYEEEQGKQNSIEIIKKFREKEINHIDFLPWFLEMKDSLGYLLYPKYGIHWSYYGSTLAVDSIGKKLSDLGEWSLPKLKITSREHSAKMRYFDKDIAQAMNLLIDLDYPPMIYPTHEWVGEKKDKKSLLVVGDSFAWDLVLRSRIGTECFDSLQFLYYNNYVFNEKETDGVSTLPRHIDLEEYLDFFDAVLLVSNEPNTIHLGYYFIEDALDIIRDPESKVKKRNNDLIQKKCLEDKKWKNDLLNRAEKRGISLDSMIQIYLYDDSFKPY